MPFANIRGSDFNYRIAGSGEPVTLVHGVGADLETWDGVAGRLEPHFQVIRYDQRGHGETAKLPGPYSLRDMVEDLKLMLDACGIEKTSLAGFSLGGLVAQSFALTYPERLRRMVLISTVAGRTEEERRKVQERANALSEQGASFSSVRRRRPLVHRSLHCRAPGSYRVAQTKESGQRS